MGGRVLDFEAKTILKRGIAQGEQEKAEKMALVLFQKKMTIPFIAEVTELSEDRIREIAVEHGLMQ